MSKYIDRIFAAGIFVGVLSVFVGIGLEISIIFVSLSIPIKLIISGTFLIAFISLLGNTLEVFE